MAIYNRNCLFVGFSLLFMTIWVNMQLGLGRQLEESSMWKMHEKWMAEYGRVYGSAEEKDKRFRIFKDNVEFIQSFNNAANRPYKLSVNKFADQTDEEFRAHHTGYRPDLKPRASNPGSFMYENVTDVSSTVDWREEGAVTGVKNQKGCGCCWAFSTVAAVEGVTKISKGTLLSLSEQELVDCNRENHGCSGGIMDLAFEFIKQNGGLAAESDYPYQGIEGTCQEPSKLSAQISGYEDVPANNEEALMKAVANQPVSVAIEASGTEFRSYSGGIFTGDCGTSLDHAVTVVGYGTSEDGIKYWLVKNSWGADWGENGYIKMQRDVDSSGGLCGIAMKASYPTAA